MVPELIQRWARERPDRPFVSVGGREMTFGALQESIVATSAELRALGVNRGDRVAFTCPSSIECITYLMAAASLGAIVTPLNIFLKGSSLEYQLRDCGCVGIITDRAGLDLLSNVAPALTDVRFIINLDTGDSAPMPPGTDIQLLKPGQAQTSPQSDPPCPAMAASDTYAIIYTSGTTGFPKGCVISNAYARNWATCLIDMCAITDRDVIFTAAPLFHISGMNPLIIALTLGTTLVFEASFSASNYLERVRATGATVAIAVGWIPQMLLKTPPSERDRDHKLRVMCTLGISIDEQQAFKARFGAETCTQQFGQTECWPVSYTPFAARETTPYAGHPAPQLIVEMHDDDGLPVPEGSVGEIVVRPCRPGAMFDGYWNDPERTLEVFKGLWYHTGDLGRFVDGQIQYVDRKKDSMRRRGENVSAFELEQVIGKYDGVAEVAVHGVKLPGEIDEVIKACLVVRSVENFDIAGFIAFVAGEMPYFAVPEMIEFLTELPRNASGRVMKEQLRAVGMSPQTRDLVAEGFVVNKAARRA